MSISAGFHSQIVRAVLVGGALLATLAVAPPPASAAGLTFTVNKNTDAPDMNLGDGVCDSSSKHGRQCTLRAAIQEANASGGANTIAFHLPSTKRTIAPTSPLPAITDDFTTIDGYTQAGASPNTLLDSDNAVIKVTLDGIHAGDADGLVIAADESTVAGLDIQRFAAIGIAVTGSSDSVIGNFIGTNAAGTAKRGNNVGVFVSGLEASVGGKKVFARNVISGNATDGVQIAASGPAFSAGVLLNFIGTNKKGNAALGNGGNGVFVNGSGALIGGIVSGQFALPNVISGNGEAGIALRQASDCTIEEDLIGTSADGSAAVPNGGSGIVVLASGPDWIGPGNVISNNMGHGVFLANASTGTEVFQSTITNNVVDGVSVISGPQTIHDNTISGNHRNGIAVQTPTATGIDIFGNSEADNVRLGIDLHGGTEDSFSVTANDAADPDTGANNLQNFPVITSAVANRFTGKTTIAGTLNSGASQDYRVEVFSAATDPSGHGEGQMSLGTVDVHTGSSSTISWSVAVAHVAPGSHVTATATLLDDDSTSEFSSNLAVSGS